jgi:hypothetical protein
VDKEPLAPMDDVQGFFLDGPNTIQSGEETEKV